MLDFGHHVHIDAAILVAAGGGDAVSLMQMWSVSRRWQSMPLTLSTPSACPRRAATWLTKVLSAPCCNNKSAVCTQSRVISCCSEWLRAECRVAIRSSKQNKFRYYSGAIIGKLLEDLYYTITPDLVHDFFSRLMVT